MLEQVQGPNQTVEHCPSCQQARVGTRCAHCGLAFQAGRWFVDRVLAQSSHSRVYLAHDEHGAKVALKELHFALVPTATEIEAFEREAKTLAMLVHPSTPRFVERFQEGTGLGLRLYVATEFVAGRSLADRIGEGPVPEAEVLAMAKTVLELLCALQRRSPAVFHRDIKPANIMFREDGSVVLVDFGSARSVEGSRTHRSTLVGTFGYMPPEQLGGTVDRTSDVFALGATVLHALTCRPPSELLASNFNLTIPTSVSPRVRAWLHQALAMERGRRFASAQAALDALTNRTVPVERIDAYQTGTRWRPLMLLGALAGAGVVATAFFRSAPEARVTPPVVVVSPPRPVPPVVSPPALTPADWFSASRSRCNNLEVGPLMARSGPPAGADGAGFGAGCYALAGRIEDAQKVIQALPTAAERTRAAERVFEIAHPVADQGEDAAAGPMMEIVLQFSPDNVQALFHAGMAEYAQGSTLQAKQRLEQFMKLYRVEDGFTGQARGVLGRIERGERADPAEPLGRH